MTFHFHLKLYQIKVISQDHFVVPYKAVTLTAGHLKLKVKGQCLTLKCRNQSECQTGWEKENLKSHHLRAFIKVSAKLISCIP